MKFRTYKDSLRIAFSYKKKKKRKGKLDLQCRKPTGAYISHIARCLEVGSAGLV